MKVRLEPGDVDPTEALIYRWEITEPQTRRVVYYYVGKAKNGAGRPLSDYKRNVGNLRRDRPYRRGKPEGFRAVHRRLSEAVRSEEEITLRFLCNVRPDENINDVERRWRRESQVREVPTEPE
jgi:hypothetical protein